MEVVSIVRPALTASIASASSNSRLFAWARLAVFLSWFRRSQIALRLFIIDAEKFVLIDFTGGMRVRDYPTKLSEAADSRVQAL
jgi:hypothetical protein